MPRTATGEKKMWRFCLAAILIVAIFAVWGGRGVLIHFAIKAAALLLLWGLWTIRRRLWGG